MKKRNRIEEEKDVQLTYKQDNVILSVDLKNFPHGDLKASKDFEDGRHIDFYEAVPGVEVRAYDEKLAKTVWAPVSYWSVHKGCELEIVDLSNGDQIFTDNDPRAIYGVPIDSTTLVPERFTPSEAMERKVVVPCLRGLRSTETTETWPYWDLTDEQLVKEVPEGHMGLELTFEFGQVLGVLAGNGWWSHKDSLTPDYRENWLFISDIKGYGAKAVEDWLSSTLGLDKVTVIEMTKETYANRYGDARRHNIKSNKLPLILDFLNASLGGEKGETHSGAGSKHLPKWISAAPKEFCRGLLCGLMTTDGSISTSGAKGKPQLVMTYSTISFDLARDVRRLCWLLGVKATISFAKVTTGGNKSWTIGLSSVDCKLNDVFRGMCHPDKLRIFQDTEVSTDDSVIKRSVLFPKEVSEIMSKWIKSPLLDSWKLWMETKYPKEYAARKYENCLYTSLRRYGNNNLVPIRFAQRLIKKAIADAKQLLLARDLVAAWIRAIESGELKQTDYDMRGAILRMLSVCMSYISYERRMHIMRSVVWSHDHNGELGNLLNELRNFWDENADFGKCLVNEPLFIKWRSVVEGDYDWAAVSEVNKTGQEEIGYDLTVPGYETFTSDTGVVLSNTMTYYVPVSQKAVDEAYRLMTPSKNQLAARDFKVLPELQEELVSGAFLASRRRNTPPKAVFNTYEEAKAAYRAGKIKADDNIIIKEMQ